MKKEDTIIVRGRTQGAALSLFISEIDEEVAYHTRRVLTAVNIKQTDEGWLMVLTANFKVQREVAFIRGEDIIGCYRNLYGLMYGGRLQWRKSKY